MDVVVVVLGGVLGFTFGRVVVRRGERVEYVEYLPKNTVRQEIVRSTEKPLIEPKDFNELVEYLRDKFMLLDITLATPDGFPIASTSDKPEEESAIAPEILGKVGKRVFNTGEVILSGKDYKLSVFEVNKDVIGFVKSSRDIHFIEIEKIRGEINRFLEVKM